MGSRQKGAESLLFAEFCKKFPVLRRMSRRDRFVYDCTHHHPVFRYRTPRVIRAFVPRTAGFFEFVLVSASVSARQKGGSGPSVSASKNSVPDSDVRDRFDDWVVGLQFVPDYPHHPVSANRTIPIRGQIGPFCGHFWPLVSQIFVSEGVHTFWRRFLAPCLCIQKFRSRQPWLSAKSERS